MNKDSSWETALENELYQAKCARAQGNEGRARVCARRAAGIIIGEYLSRHKQHFPNPSAHERLKYISQLTDASPKAREIAAHLLLRVNPDSTLPIDVDLIQETRLLAVELLDT